MGQYGEPKLSDMGDLGDRAAGLAHRFVEFELDEVWLAQELGSELGKAEQRGYAKGYRDGMIFMRRHLMEKSKEV